MDRVLSRADTADRGRFRSRGQDDDEREEDWWFASTGIPLIAATVAPLANVLSIAALVVSWRMSLVPGGKDAGPSWNGDPSTLVQELTGDGFPDPAYCYDMNAVSLVCGFLGNLFLLANFTNRIRYIIVLPASIICWYLSTGLLMAGLISMNMHDAPIRPQETYTQGFWYGVIAAVLYLVCSMSLMINMLGYFLGHYGQHFNLTGAQRTLILQTMMFFIWLAGGAAVFSRVESIYSTQHWLYTDALYFCDVTILTVGFGDLYPQDDIGRGLVFPYTVGGTIMLGLVISSLTKFVKEISSENIVRKRFNTARKRTLEKSNKGDAIVAELRRGSRPSISSPIDATQVQAALDEKARHETQPSKRSQGPLSKAAHAAGKASARARPKRRRFRKAKAILLREEKERFEAMRAIEHRTQNFKRYTALTISVTAFATLWCVGAAVFFVTERHTQGLSYFQTLYFAYVSLLTIGYGDESPKSNAGRPFFVVWSLLAVPTMTILVSDMGDTIIGSFRKGTDVLGDFTILPKYGIWRKLIGTNPWLLKKLQQRAERKEAKKRVEAGFETGPESEEAGSEAEQAVPTLDALVNEEVAPPSDHDLARKLALEIRKTAQHLKDDTPKRYTYEEWVHITELIRFSSKRRQNQRATSSSSDAAADGRKEEQEAAEEEEFIEWDWIGENSPMMAFGKSEPEFVLDRLCESMVRYIKAQGPEDTG